MLDIKHEPPKPNPIAMKFLTGLAIRVVLYTLAGPILGEFWATIASYIPNIF